jgi:hypothetical protein
MKHTHLFGGLTATFLLLPLAVASGIHPSNDGPADGGLVERLLATWKAARGEAITSEVRVRIYRFFDRDARQLERQKLTSFVEGLKGPFDANAADAFKNLLPNKTNDNYYWGQEMLILTDGVSVLNKIRTGFGFELITSYNGTDEVRYTGLNSEATASARSPVELFNLDSVRTIPYLGENTSPSDLTVNGQANGFVTLATKGGLKIVVESETGYIARLMSPQDGPRVHEIIQVGKLKGANSAYPVPLTVFKVSYERDHVRLLTIFALEKVVINEERNKKEFAVSVPAGTRIADMRSGSKQPLSAPLAKPIDDVLAYMNSMRKSKVTCPRFLVQVL